MAGPGNDKGPESLSDEARLARLSTALEGRRAEQSAVVQPKASPGTGDSGGAMARGMRVTSELVGGVLMGGFIGWQLDAWLGTRPWLSILCFLLGMVGGFWNVVRAAGAGPAGGRDDTPKGPGA